MKSATVATNATPGSAAGPSAYTLIDRRIAEAGDRRGPTSSRMRRLIGGTDPDAVEDRAGRPR